MIGERGLTQKKAHKAWLRSRIAVQDGAGNRMYTLRRGQNGYWWVRVKSGDEMAVHEDELRPAND